MHSVELQSSFSCTSHASRELQLPELAHQVNLVRHRFRNALLLPDLPPKFMQQLALRPALRSNAREFLRRLVLVLDSARDQAFLGEDLVHVGTDVAPLVLGRLGNVVERLGSVHLLEVGEEGEVCRDEVADLRDER